jgi:hypothetical protein
MPTNTITFPGQTIKRGTGIPQGRVIRYGYDPQKGFDNAIEYSGISQTELNQLFQNYVAQGIACELILHDDVGELRVTDSTPIFTIDSWEIVAEDERNDGLSHPTMVALDDAYGEVILFLRASLEDNTSGDDVYNALLNMPYNMSEADAQTATRFYDLQVRQSTDYRVAQYVLRHKTNVSNRWQVNITDVGVNTIYSPAQLLTEVTDSGLWIFPLPERLQFKIGAIPPIVPDENQTVPYFWGWLKGPSTESNAANNRIPNAAPPVPAYRRLRAPCLRRGNALPDFYNRRCVCEVRSFAVAQWWVPDPWNQTVSSSCVSF